MSGQFGPETTHRARKITVRKTSQRNGGVGEAILYGQIVAETTQKISQAGLSAKRAIARV